MIISYLSDDPKGPSAGKQRALIAEAGIEPEREFAGNDLELFNVTIREGDQIVIAHHRAFLGPRLTRLVLELCAREKVTINLVGDRVYDPNNIEDFHAFLAVAAKRWAKFGRRAKGHAIIGRPIKHKVPAGVTLEALKHMWWNPRTDANPDGFTAPACYDYASDALGYDVQRWQIKHWISDLRQKPDDGLAKIEKRKR